MTSRSILMWAAIIVSLTLSGCGLESTPSNSEDNGDSSRGAITNGENPPIAQIQCKSGHRKQRNYCAAPFTINLATVKRLVSGRCRQGVEWGIDDRTIWVVRYCHAVFEVRGFEAPPYNQANELAYLTGSEWTSYPLCAEAYGTRPFPVSFLHYEYGGLVYCPKVPGLYIDRSGNHAIEYLGKVRVYGVGVAFEQGASGYQDLLRDPTGALFHRPFLRGQFRNLARPIGAYAFDEKESFDTVEKRRPSLIPSDKDDRIQRYRFQKTGMPMRRVILKVPYRHPVKKMPGERPILFMFSSHIMEDPFQEKWEVTNLSNLMFDADSAEIYRFADDSFLEEIVSDSNRQVVRRRKGESNWTVCGDVSLQNRWYFGSFRKPIYYVYEEKGLLKTAPSECSFTKLGQNPINPGDVNNDRVVNELDVSQIKNYKGARFSSHGPNLVWKSIGIRPDGTFLFPDVNGDNSVTDADIGELRSKYWTIDAPTEERDDSWTNPKNNADVNGDGRVTNADVLIIVNWLSKNKAGSCLPGPRPNGHFLDVNGDKQVTDADILAVMNRLNNP